MIHIYVSFLLQSSPTIIDVVRDPIPAGASRRSRDTIVSHVPGAPPAHLRPKQNQSLNSANESNPLPLDGDSSVDIVEGVTVVLEKTADFGLGITVAGYVCEKGDCFY